MEKNERTRYDRFKRHRLNRLLNLGIGFVLTAIVIVSVQFFVGTFNNNETVRLVPSSEEETDENEGEEDAIPNETEQLGGVEEVDKELEETGKEGLLAEEGEWRPIGTVQEEPFVADYTTGGINWKEMTQALTYATGLGDNMEIWRIENGGSPQRAVGTVSTYEQRHTPFQVTLEWVTNEGWMPVEVISLSENKYVSE